MPQAVWRPKRVAGVLGPIGLVLLLALVWMPWSRPTLSRIFAKITGVEQPLAGRVVSVQTETLTIERGDELVTMQTGERTRVRRLDGAGQFVEQDLAHISRGDYVVVARATALDQLAERIDVFPTFPAEVGP